MSTPAPAILERPGRVEVRWDRGLLPTQEKFFRSEATRKIYIGPFGSGKTVVLCRAFLSFMFLRPGNRGLIGRYTNKDFKETTLLTLKQLIPKGLIHPDTKESDGKLCIWSCDGKTPSTIQYTHYDEEEHFGSGEYGVVAMDEITQIPYKVLEYIEGRMRHKSLKGESLPAYYVMGAGNPNGHDRYWKAFHPTSPDRKPGYEWFTPKPFENAGNLPPRYYEDMIERHGPEWVRRYVYGDCDTFEGQVYPDLSEKVHRRKNNVIPMPPPLEWPRIISLDHGLRNPTSVGFWCVDYDGNIWRYDEHYESGKPVKHHAKIIKERFAKHCQGAREIAWVADPSIWAKTQSRGSSLWSIFDEYAEYGLDDWQPGDNDKVAGRDRVTMYIRSVKLFALERCQHWWDEMTRLHWRKTVVTSFGERAVEEEADIDNHAPDETRYCLMTLPEAPKRRTEKIRDVSVGEFRKERNKRITKQIYQSARQQTEESSRFFDPGDFV